MKKYKIMTISIVGIIAFLSLIGINLYAKYYIQKKEQIEKISIYLQDTFDEPMEIDSISIADGCNAICNPIDNKNFKFAVTYWSSENKYINSYYKVCLELEAKDLIQTVLSNECLNVDYELYLQLVEGPPVKKYEELTKISQQLNRPLSWKDGLCNEELEYVQIIIKDKNIDKNIALRIVEKIPIPYKRIIVSVLNSKNIILDITN